MLLVITDGWIFYFAVLNFLLSLGVSMQAILYKRDTRGVIGWVGLIWLVPILGPMLYLILGVNRIRRTAYRLRRTNPLESTGFSCNYDGCEKDIIDNLLLENHSHLLPLNRLVNKVTKRPLISGNKIVPFFSGDDAYFQMIEAIQNASTSITLCSYIFGTEGVGKDFITALSEANNRGVEVRILIDGVGARYSRPSAVTELQKEGVSATYFLPPKIPHTFPFTNLRNHRKVMVVDGKLGFTGGMNIWDKYHSNEGKKESLSDLHFRLEGPIVTQLQDVFAVDWFFCTNEALEGNIWFPDLANEGDMLVRGIAGGPDEDFEKLRFTLLGALSVAQHSIWIVTPYFLPEAPLIFALSIAAMKGIEVNIIVPSENNLKLVQWASYALFWQLLEHKCKIWLSPPPFDHTKLFVVDERWFLFGSSNWDPRSLRLNFEFDVECYDANLAHSLKVFAEEKTKNAELMTLKKVNNRKGMIQLRDGVARLFSPYL